ncbi:MAG: hydroxymethylglutaryl-CoA synthase [Myxococcota bacterium]
MSDGNTRTGIASLAIQLPSRVLDVRDLATLRGIDPNKFTKGLGCGEIALCADGEDVVSLAAGAAKRAIARWGGNVQDIGLLVVGSETAQDMSRPLSSFVADAIGLEGAFRSYETKHACYGGTVALRQALEWRASGAARGKAALVIAADVALYAPKDPGEPTQGAGAVAFVVAEPKVAEVDLASYAWSEPVFDFWRPVGESFPRVDGPLSLDCYNRGALKCFQQLADERFGGDLKATFEHFEASCFHVPFPKMVKKAVKHIGESAGWDDATTAGIYESKVDPTMRWNRQVGNSYTAALWMSVASVLAGSDEGTEFAAFSYGSGFGTELLTLKAGPAAKDAAWTSDFEADVAGRERIDADTYEAWRTARPVAAE